MSNVYTQGGKEDSCHLRNLSSANVSVKIYDYFDPSGGVTDSQGEVFATTDQYFSRSFIEDIFLRHRLAENNVLPPASVISDLLRQAVHYIDLPTIPV